MRERWDIVLRFLDGPLERRGDILLHGPMIRLGANPGPEGLMLSGYRGLDDRQAVLAVYENGHATIAPVGTSQVRLAPHEHQDWNEVLPLREAAYLSEGCAFHLGPPNRGVTVRFVACRRLGEWSGGKVVSEAAADARARLPGGALDERPPQELEVDGGVPIWFKFGAPALLATIVVGIGLLTLDEREIAQLGPKYEGQDGYPHIELVDLDRDLTAEEAKNLEGFKQAFSYFVMKQNADAAGRQRLLNEENWDERLYKATLIATQPLVESWSFWERLDEVVDDYAFVVGELQGAGLPEVFAAIPYQESRYRSEAQSPVCAKGYWQLMPEVANRMELNVAGCKFKGSQTVWSPTALAPPVGVLKNAAYIQDDQCRISSCSEDERTELGLSTEAAIEMLREAWEDDDIANSGAAVQITIISHNAGYDDEPYVGKRKRYNVLPAYQMWLEEQGLDADPHFVGEQIRCADHAYNNLDPCGSKLQRETQHYAYNVIAQHFLAACYYGQNYADRYSEFKAWKSFTQNNGYCAKIKVPTAQEVQER